MNVAIVGAGWAGLAAAVEAVRAGHRVTVFEAARTVGGRARAVPATLADGRAVTLDNGQHILIGAYSETLRLMREVGVDVDAALLRTPLALVFPDGRGLRFARLPAPLDALAGILGARGWSWRDKASLLGAALGWQRAGFDCPAQRSVAELCAALTPRVRQEMIEPLCVSALNTPAAQASGRVFLRVLRDAMFGASGGSHLLLPRTDLGRLFPEAAADWLGARGGRVVPGRRVEGIAPVAQGWTVDGESFDQVVLACPPGEAARLVETSGLAAPPRPRGKQDDEPMPPDVAAALPGKATRVPGPLASGARAWCWQARALRFEAIATIYLEGGHRLPAPMLALRATPEAPAQFVFDRAWLGDPAGLWTLVVSASASERAILEAQVCAQATAQLGCLRPRVALTVVEKRATFACTPGLARPAARIAPGLSACGDYIDGPYPATLEGAVRSGVAVLSINGGS
ncbi:MAG: UDP-galactopyranose mutase [Variovorax sp.]|nr:UDP-galactopyranose mutase [Variovorax sp.]